MDDISLLRASHIYILIDPLDGEIRYVGKSVNPTARLANHLNDRSKCHRTNWIQSLARQGLKPELVIVESMIGAWPWQEAERYWIFKLRQLGCNLTNGTSGGDGTPDLSPESRERIRQTWIGRRHRPESIKKIGDASRGRKHTAEHKERMRQTMIGREITWIDKVAEGVRKFSDSEISDIQARIKTGALVKDIAAEFSAHRTTISKIKKGTYYERNRKPKSTASTNG